jgi:pyruvate dehydrogenase E2 component (dihydrolipoamide acetyltransferase)
MSKEIKLPELGENIAGAQVLSVLVSPGDRIEKDQTIIEIETDKATAEVPSEMAGVVREIKVKEGDQIKVGQAILVIDEQGNGAGSKPAEAAAQPAAAPAPAPAPARAPEAAPPRAVAPPRPETPSEPEPAVAAPPVAAAPLHAAPPPAPPAAPRPPLRLTPTPADALPASPAAPSVRRLARELGIDVNDVPGTGPDGRISLEDVKAYARQILSGAAPTLEDRGAPRISNAPAAAFSIPDLPDFSRFGEVERVTTNKVRKVTAETMALSWNVIPHVTQFDRADITELEPWRARYAPRVEAAGGKLTVTAIAVKVVASALKVFPKFNASYDHREQELVLKKYINVGVAVDTDHGLLVPVIRDADRKNITTIAAELAELSEKSRTRKIALDDLQGANFNISNLGGLGTTYFSPIVAWPQVAVLGMGRANVEAVHRDGAFVPRSILPLAVSYDHRAVDGADCARFLRWIAEAMEQPLLLALEG